MTHLGSTDIMLKVDLRFSLLEDYLQRIFDLVEQHEEKQAKQHEDVMLKIDLRFSLLEDYLQRVFDLVDQKKPQPAKALRRSVSPSGKSEPQPAAAVRRPVSPSGKSEPKQLRTRICKMKL